MAVDTKQYIEMQKQEYEHSAHTPDYIVGNYDWHEEFPYETQLLYENGDLRYPLLGEAERGRALDFACGPGRMIPRMSKFFKQVDGVDIAPRLIEEARRRVPANSELWATNGDDLGGAPSNAYDFIYCTISMQHISVWDVRMRIMRQMRDALKVGGCVTLQMAFNPTYPLLPAAPIYRFETNRFRKIGTHLMYLGGQLRGILLANTDLMQLDMKRVDTEHALWRENRTDAGATNSGCDVTISDATLPQVKADFEELFGNFKCWWYDVSLVFKDLRGQRHEPHSWATHWIFLHAKKVKE